MLREDTETLRERGRAECPGRRGDGGSGGRLRRGTRLYVDAFLARSGGVDGPAAANTFGMITVESSRVGLGSTVGSTVVVAGSGCTTTTGVGGVVFPLENTYSFSLSDGEGDLATLVGREGRGGETFGTSG